MKTIQTDQYILLVNRKDGFEYQTWYILTDARGDFRSLERMDSSTDWTHMDSPKVIAHLPIGDAPRLDGVPLLPDVEQQEDVEYEKQIWKDGFKEGYDRFGILHKGHDLEPPFKRYWKDRAASSKKYTEEDMKEAMLYAAGISKGRGTFDVGLYEDEITKYLQSLHPTPVTFEPETEEYTPAISHETSEDWTEQRALKIIPVSDWEPGMVAGKWIY